MKITVSHPLGKVTDSFKTEKRIKNKDSIK